MELDRRKKRVGRYYCAVRREMLLIEATILTPPKMEGNQARRQSEGVVHDQETYPLATADLIAVICIGERCMSAYTDIQY
jgi:hypothetical protein